MSKKDRPIATEAQLIKAVADNIDQHDRMTNAAPLSPIQEKFCAWAEQAITEYEPSHV
jgi:hypothetical protein